MKKIILLTIAIVSATVAAHASGVKTLVKNTTRIEPKWEKSKVGTFVGKKKTWYKINTKDATVWQSKNGKNWLAVKDGMWQDKEGKWLKIIEKDLKWSADGGKTWTTVPDWKWEDENKVWNKFDKDWNLWTVKA